MHAFLHTFPPRFPHPKQDTKHRQTCPIPIAQTASPSRRLALKTIAALTAGLPLGVLSRTPEAPLATSLVPIVRVHDALSTLSDDVESGTNGDVRRAVRLILAGNDLPRAARQCSAFLTEPAATEMQTHTREANEYLHQVIDYFDPVASRERPVSQMLKFALQAIDAARVELDAALDPFGNQVDEARKLLQGPPV